MSLTLSGRLIGLVRSDNTDRETGAITQVVAAEILHQERGKSVIESLKFDLACIPGWEKAVGQNVELEVRMYAMKSNSGGIQSGLALADKKAYPVVVQATPVSTLKAA
nr:hypothetical protein [uncultured Rhodoferax sp.]